MDNAAAIRERASAVWRGDEFGKLVATLEIYLSEEDLKGIIDAYELSARAHEGQQRLSGHAYITHPVAVATILADMRLDAGTICSIAP